MKTKVTQKKALYALIAFLVGIFSHILFLFVNPKFVYEYHPNLLMYKSFDGQYIANKNIYFYFVKKYGYNYDSYAKFKTIEESIEALEFAKKYPQTGVYYSVFMDMERFGYDKILKIYKDEKFIEYMYKYFPDFLGYKTFDKQYIENENLYLELFKKYGFNDIGYAKFKTMAESIKILEFAKNNMNSALYKQVFHDLNRFGYDNVLKTYKDKIFQLYFVYSFLRVDVYDQESLMFLFKNYPYLVNIQKYTDDEMVKGIAFLFFEKYKTLDKNDTKQKLYEFNYQMDDLYGGFFIGFPGKYNVLF